MNRHKLKEETAAAAGAFAIGAAAMYLMDPARGRRRRSLLRDKAVHATHGCTDALRKSGKYFRGQARGAVAEARSHLHRPHVSDEQLAARVRSAMGRVVSHAGSIQVSVRDGIVALRGLILSDEVDALLRTAGRLRGVRRLVNDLEPHRRSEAIPGLQGRSPRPYRLDLLQENWNPSTRMMMGLLGAGLCAWGAVRRNLLGRAALVGGLGLLARACTNLETRRLTGLGAGSRAVEIQKTININAPVEKVFQFFTDYRNFPHFMANVLEVRDHGDGRSHWVVHGPAGAHVSWDARITQFVPNRILAWKSVENSTVEHAGIIHFEPNRNGGTRVHVQMAYNPILGALGHAVARLFGADPKSEMDEDLVRVKTMIETGHPAHDAARPIKAHV